MKKNEKETETEFIPIKLFKKEITKKAIFFIGLGIFCAVIGLQLGLHDSDIRKLKNEVKELRSENEAFKFCFKKLGFVIGFEESESREEK